jgi:hypothetical protein
MAKTKQRVLQAFLRSPAVLIGIAAILGGGHRAQAMSEETIHIEQFVNTDAGDGSLFTEMLIYDEDTWIASFAERAAEPIIVDAIILMEDGATVLSFTPSQILDTDARYIPFDFEVQFSTSGVFAGKMELAYQLGDQTLLQNHHFWISHDDAGSAYISNAEYLNRLRAAIKPLPSDPNANLEPDDVPGESVVSPRILACRARKECPQ